MVLFFRLFVKKKSKAAAEPGRRGHLAFLHFFSLLYDPVQHKPTLIISHNKTLAAQLPVS